jgi:hypothetical protein
MLSRLNEDCSRMMFLDIETIPDMSRADLFDLPPISIEDDSKFPTHQEVVMGADGNKAVDLVDRDLKQLMPEGCTIWPSQGWFDEAVELEVMMGRDRKGVVQKLNMRKARAKKALEARHDSYAKLSVQWDKCRICCIGYAIAEGDPVILWGGDTTDEERRMLEAFWDEASQVVTFTGYNITAFDFPVIFARSAGS